VAVVTAFARVVPPAEVPDLVAPGIASLGEGIGHPTAAALSERLGVCPECVIAVYRHAAHRHAAGGDIVLGYAIAYPLAADAVDKLSRGQLVSGRELTLEHLVTSWPLAVGAYVAVVFSAGGPRAAAAVVTTVPAFIEDATGKSVPIFARPATPAGRRIMARLGMLRIEVGDTQVWATQPRSR
jgi:hypothetical protein